MKPAAPTPHPALEWVEESTLTPGTRGTHPAAGAAASVTISPDLLSDRPTRSPLRAGVLLPIFTVLLLVAGYVSSTLLWPLHEVPPVISAAEVTSVSAPLTTPEWPDEGSAAVGVGGMAGTVSSTAEPAVLASITKVVTALLVLDQQPLALGESGPEYSFTVRDRYTYWDYLARGESALDVPVGGTLTQYQLLQGMLIGSGGNYAERLVSSLWPSDEVFAQAAHAWLSAHGLGEITVVEPTGFDEDNRAAPGAVLALAERAMADPVIAEIVDTESVTLPGAGTIHNTNDLLADPAVTGVKTGSLWGAFNLVAARDVQVGDTTVRVYATALEQPTDALRDGETARLLAAVSDEVARPAALPAATLVGTVSTPWGESAEIVTDAAAEVVLWNGGTATSEAAFDLGEARAEGATVGQLVFRGPLDSDTVELRLTDDLEPPTAWWRLTHPLELFGLID